MPRRVRFSHLRKVQALAFADGGLTALGYKPQEALRMVKAVDAEGLGSEAIIRAALKGAAG